MNIVRNLFSVLGFLLIILLIYVVVIRSDPGEGIGETSWPDVVTSNEYFSAKTGGDAVAKTLSLDSYVVMNMSLEETFDKNGCFTVTANEICYTCARSIQIQANAAISFIRDSGSGTDIITFAFGKDLTGQIGNGDEFGDDFMRTHNATLIGMGEVAATVALTQNDCISLLAKTNDISGGSDFTMKAANICFIEP